MVILVFPAVVRMVVWMTQKKGLYDGRNFSHRNLIFFFKFQLWSHNPRQKVGRTKEGKVGIVFPSSCVWQGRSGSFDTHSW